MAGAYTRYPSPANKPDQKRRRLIPTTTTSTTSSLPQPTLQIKTVPRQLPQLPQLHAPSPSRQRKPPYSSLLPTLPKKSAKINPRMVACLALCLTGGGVCNKLLGTRSVDVGLGIINERVRFPNSALQVHQGKHGEIRLRSVNKIESNPEESKHLKPTTTKTLGLDIDPVNLRRGNYSDHSRIQHMICSTLSSTITWGILTAAPGIRKGRKGCPPP